MPRAPAAETCPTYESLFIHDAKGATDLLTMAQQAARPTHALNRENYRRVKHSYLGDSPFGQWLTDPICVQDAPATGSALVATITNVAPQSAVPEWLAEEIDASLLVPPPDSPQALARAFAIAFTPEIAEAHVCEVSRVIQQLLPTISSLLVMVVDQVVSSLTRWLLPPSTAPPTCA